MQHSDIVAIIIFVVLMALLAGYNAGTASGYTKARKEFKSQLDRATDDYRQATDQLRTASRLVEKMRNRMRASHILYLKTRLNHSDRLAK